MTRDILGDKKNGEDATPLGPRLLSVSLIAYPLRASVRMDHLSNSVKSWILPSVISVGDGRSPVEACYTTASCTHVYIFVADTRTFFDTADRGILDYVLSRLGLPTWFWHVFILNIMQMFAPDSSCRHDRCHIGTCFDLFRFFPVMVCVLLQSLFV